MRLIKVGLFGVIVGLILLAFMGGCANQSLMTPKGCEAWVNMNVPGEFSCYPRAEFCRAHLAQNGYFCKTIAVKGFYPMKHAIVECRDKYGKVTELFNN